MLILLVIIIIIFMWSFFGFFSARVEQADYKVLEKKSDYEIREYPARLVAQTAVKGAYGAALSAGFRIVAGYIFGSNTKKERISMTAPVTTQKEISEKIAMTAPVMATMQGDSHVISFGMPRSYTFATLPVPNDSRVKIVSVPVKKFAVLRFSYSRSEERIKAMESKLLGYLKRDGITYKDGPVYAGYSSPWTPPWMVRNEIMVEL
jgi:hypothetical protein